MADVAKTEHPGPDDIVMQIRIAPWASADTVKQECAEAQRELLEELARRQR